MNCKESYSYDLHIHSCLSPCGDNDMTPNNVVNMAKLKGLDFIAVSDHNTVKNVEAFMGVANNLDIIIVPAMELETSEEIHMLCLFKDIESAFKFEDIVEKSRKWPKNKKEIFGDQIIMDENDNAIGEIDRLLVTASGLDIYTAVQKVKEMGGAIIPAHIDRKSYSILSNLGLIPDDLDINALELSKNTDANAFSNSYRELTGRKLDINNYKLISNSDAHYLYDINEKCNYIALEEKNIESLINTLNSK